MKEFKRKITPGDPRKVFPSTIVVSYRDREDLPSQFEHGTPGSAAQRHRLLTIAGVEKLCQVQSDLTAIAESEFKAKNKQFWKPGPKYYEVQYEVKVIIGPADLRFELCEYSWASNRPHRV